MYIHKKNTPDLINYSLPIPLAIMLLIVACLSVSNAFGVLSYGGVNLPDPISVGGNFDAYKKTQTWLGDVGNRGSVYNLPDCDLPISFNTSIIPKINTYESSVAIGAEYSPKDWGVTRFGYALTETPMNADNASYSVETYDRYAFITAI
jgi:hypothetical protein